MELVAFISAIAGILIFAAAAVGVPRTWATVAHGLIWFGLAVLIWHSVGGLDPLFD
jgi:hypothetical protein